MKIDLNGKIAIVSGSIQGIGLEIAKTLAKAGAAVVINNHRDEEILEAEAEKIRAEGGKAAAVIADVTKKSEAEKLVAAAKKFGDGVDILVNNAGGLVGRVPVADFQDDHFQTVIDVNLKTAFVVSSVVMPEMKKKKGGKVINLSSQAAHDGGGGGAAAYAASKGGIWTFTKSLAKELAPNGITVNCVAPGFIGNTVFHNTFTPKEVHEKVPSMVPLGRAGEPADIANVVLFLASPLSDYLTGQTIEVNGGLYMP